MCKEKILRSDFLSHDCAKKVSDFRAVTKEHWVNLKKNEAEKLDLETQVADLKAEKAELEAKLAQSLAQREYVNQMVDTQK